MIRAAVTVEIPMPSPTNRITFFALPDSFTTAAMFSSLVATLTCADLNHSLSVNGANCDAVNDVAGALQATVVSVTSAESSSPLSLLSSPVRVSVPPFTHCSEPTANVFSTVNVFGELSSSSEQPANATTTAREIKFSFFIVVAIILQLVLELG